MKAVLGQVVFSDDPSSNPADAHSFFVKFALKRTKIIKKGPGSAH